MTRTRITTLGLVLRSAVRKRAQPGWVYFASTKQLSMETPCLWVEGDQGEGECAAEAGFPECGLDAATIEGLIVGLRHIGVDLSDEALLQAFVYYLKYDTFLPKLNAPPPPSLEEVQRRSDREFIDALGPERPGTNCKADGCARGRIEQSVFCRAHHFEAIKKRPCPFAD